MIGVFDSGFGGLTVFRALAERFQHQDFVYLGDHANVPYGNRPADDVLKLTQAAVAHLFASGCRLVLLGCNTATAVAARHMQTNWLPTTEWKGRGHNVLGIIAPTVEAATQTPWAVTTPQYPQKYNAERIAVFGTARTVSSGVYAEEISKRCPRVQVQMIVCPGLAGAIEARAPRAELSSMVEAACSEADAPDRAILGCTHFPLAAELFSEHLPANTRILSQPNIVADSLENYFERHPHFVGRDKPGARDLRLMTTGDPAVVSEHAAIFWRDAPEFVAA